MSTLLMRTAKVLRLRRILGEMYIQLGKKFQIRRKRRAMKWFQQREMKGMKIHAQKSSHHHLKISSTGRERVQKSSKHHHKIILPKVNNFQMMLCII